MNVVVVPDAAMIVIPLIEKNGHVYLSPSNFSRYDNTGICDGNFTFDFLLDKYSSSELPSGVKGRLFLFSKVLNKADAAIIIGKRPKNYVRMYSSLNDLILFGGNSCNNYRSLAVKMISDLDIPTLRLSYPTTKGQIIELIDKANSFLKNPDNADLNMKKDKYPVIDFKMILNRLI